MTKRNLKAQWTPELSTDLDNFTEKPANGHIRTTLAIPDEPDYPLHRRPWTSLCQVRDDQQHLIMYTETPHMLSKIRSIECEACVLLYFAREAKKNA